MNISRYFSLIMVVALFTAGCKGEKKLPYLGHREANETVAADGTKKIDTIYQSIPDFQFVNQDSIVLTQEQFKGKIYVADFFFTSCSTICPTMHRHLKEVFDMYRNNPDVMYLSHTIDFKYDKPAILKKYAQKLGVYGPQWQFAYGPKEQVYNIAQQHYLVAVGEDNTAVDGYVHQGYLVLIDKEKHIRGAYDGTDENQVAQLKKDVQILLNEYK